MITVEIVDAWPVPDRGDVDMLHIAALRNGEGHMFVMPADTLETRAAEYDIDPGEFDTLLDMVLAEFDVEQSADHPDFLYNAPTRGHARDAHLRRCRERVRVSQSAVKRVMEDGTVGARAAGEPTPREKIRAIALLDAEVIEAKVEMVERGRARAAVERARPPRRVVSPTERAAAVRRISGER